MLTWMQVVILSLVQGLTEFLPVSSSAHLILVPNMLGFEDQGLAFDIAVHVGTLVAVITYFRAEIVRMVRDFIKSLFGKKITEDAKLLWCIGFATIPVGLAGLFLHHWVETALRSPIVIAITTIFFGLILWWSDAAQRHQRKLSAIYWRDVIVIGVAQALSLIPGTSRSGITLTAGLFSGFTKEAAARFSFLLSIPVILLAGGLETVKLVHSNLNIDWMSLGLGVLISAVSGYLCIHYFLKWLNTVGLFPFVLYRIFLGIFLFFYFS